MELISSNGSTERRILEIANNTEKLIENSYLKNKDSYEILDLDLETKDIEFARDIRFLHITKFIYDETENILKKLESIFSSIYELNTSLLFFIKSDGLKSDIYLGIRDKVNITKSFNTLKGSLSGNFPGMLVENKLSSVETEQLMNNIINDNIYEISAITGSSSLKSENQNLDFIQGIEKLIEGMRGRKFSTMLIADPIPSSINKLRKRNYESCYSKLYPFLSSNISLSKSEAQSLSLSLGKTFTESYTKSFSTTDTTFQSESTTVGGGVSAPIGGGFGASANASQTSTSGSSHSVTEGESFGKSESNSKTKSISQTDTIGKTIQITNKNKTVENILVKLETEIEKLEYADGNGMWNIGTYFISNDPQDSIIAGNMYNGILKGEKSNLEKSGVYSFYEGNQLEKIKDYLYNVSNPKIKISNEGLNIFKDMGSFVNNEELSIRMNFPKTSITGVEVIKMNSFGLNQKNIENLKSIKLGNIYHLGNKINIESRLDINTLSSHTFITGSTGAGKSNAVYTILRELMKKNIKFMVVEPAKGEYKDIFGGRKNVSVYGTNKKYTELLKINPFSFNKEIHIQEHIDRLIEIFNACWPMYAAMPAMLKEAIEDAYLKEGWDLLESNNLFGLNKFPNFTKLKISLEKIISMSSYSEEVKNNYSGALITRINSMGNGLIGQIFVDDELSEDKLFEENVIVDISRIPSMETKSLIMGILFTKLHEYKIGTKKNSNSDLKHVTVLEEAHNLLKRTSSSQSQEGENLQGKSVEMLTNAIAEMRTYGEGFIIADQAPGLLDESVIRNTNTKICLRLPSFDDRELVGSSMNLNENQIIELGKLDIGVAAIYQNDWEESNLVKFDYMDKIYNYTYEFKESSKDLLKDSLRYILRDKLKKEDRKRFKYTELEIEEYYNNHNIKFKYSNNEELDTIVYDLLNADRILKVLGETDLINVKEWDKKCRIILKNILNLNIEHAFETKIINSIIRKKAIANNKINKFHKEWFDINKEINNNERNF